jgi:hypothetical protein
MNEELKLCVDCKYYERIIDKNLLFFLGEAKATKHFCLRSRKEITSLVTGKPKESGEVYECEKEREKGCGPKGRFFEPKKG